MQLSRFYSSSLIALACGMVAFVSTFGDATCAQEIHTTELNETVNDWIMDKSSGRVFATLVDGDFVVEFDSKGQEVRRISVNVSPTEMVIKGNFLVVGCTKSPVLCVIDLSTNKKAGEIKLNGKGPYALFCSEVDNGYVYCVCNTGTAWWDGEVFQCDLKTMKIRKQLKVSGWGQSHVVHVAMSPDGSWIVPDARGASSPSGADLMKVDEEECTFQQLHHHHDSFGPIVAAPSNRFWTLGKALYSQDIKKMLRTFGGEPVAIHPTLDLVASFAGNQLILEKFSDAASVTKIALKGKVDSPKNVRPQNENFPTPGDIVVQIDAERQTVFVGTRTQGYWIDIREFVPSVSELSILLTPSQVNAIIGNEIKIPISSTGSKNATEIEIANGPKAIKIVNGHLVWRPTAADIGDNLVKLDLKSAKNSDVLDSIDININVRPQNIELGMSARGIEVSPNGKLLVAWGPTPGQERPHPSHVGSDDIAVFDIQESKVIAKKTIPQGIKCVTVDDSYLFLAPHSGNLVYRLSPKLDESQRIFVQSSPARLIRFGKSLLLTVPESDLPQIVDTTQMKAVDGIALGLLNQNRRFEIIANDQYLLVENRLYDRKSGELLRTMGAANLPSLASTVSNNQGFRNTNKRLPTWGRFLSGNSLVNVKDSRIASIQGQKFSILSERWPLVVSVDLGITSPARSLSFINIVDGTSIQSTVIDPGTPNLNPSEMMLGLHQHAMVLRDDKIFCLARNRVLISEIPTEIRESLVAPPHFGPVKMDVVEADKPVKIKPLVSGDVKDLAFNLLMEYEGISVDIKTGEISIDAPLMWKSFTTNVIKEMNQFAQAVPNLRGTELEPLKKEIASQFKILTGKELPKDKFATQIPISLSLQSADGQVDELHYSVIVLGNLADVEKRLQEAKQEQEKQMAVARAEQEKRQAEMQARMEAQRKPAQPVGDVNGRIEALENRMRRMEAALDSILKKLDEDKK